MNNGLSFQVENCPRAKKGYFSRMYPFTGTAKVRRRYNILPRLKDDKPRTDFCRNFSAVMSSSSPYYIPLSLESENILKNNYQL
jgi:hypothetical protein